MNIKISKKDYFWSYASYILKFGVNLFVFPVVLRMLSSSEYGLWVTFSSIGTVINLLDFGFSSTILRNLTYIWGGASNVNEFGVPEVEESSRNDRLFVLALLTCKRIYFKIAIWAITFSAVLGSAYVIFITRSYFLTEYLIAWIMYSLSISMNLYYTYAIVSLKSVGLIEKAQKASVFGGLIQLIVSDVGLSLGGGLIVLSAAGCLRAIVMFISAKYYFLSYSDILNIINIYKKTIQNSELRNIFLKFWYNAKKAGISTIATVIITQSSVLLSSAFLGVEVTGELGLCIQILSLLSAAAQIQYQTVYPRLIQERMLPKIEKQKKTFSTSLVFSWGVFIIGFYAAYLAVPFLLDMIGSKTQFNRFIYCSLACVFCGEMTYSMSASFISMENRLPFVPSVVLTSIITMMLSLLFVKVYPSAYALICARLISEGSYIFWKWPMEASKCLRVTFLQLMYYGVKEWKKNFKKIVDIMQ